MRDLIERLERATGPDRELGHKVLLACGWRRTCVGHFYGPLWHWSSPDGKRSWSEESLPCPTASLDAVLKLMPDGWIWDVSSSGCAWIMRDDDSFCDSQIVISGIGNPIIALCIAALKAREAAK